LVSAVQKVAHDVTVAYPGSVLLVGNMSQRHGGDIPGSVSHNSGRDADLGFFARTSEGKAVNIKSLQTFDARGRSGPLHFDAARNWLVVQSLLQNPAIQVQWIFVSESLRERLLSYARATGLPSVLIDKASHVLSQPGNSSSHADHFHVRIYCEKHERLSGCINYGPIWPWVNDHQVAVDSYARKQAEQVTHADTKKALKAIQTIADIRGRTVRDSLVNALADPRKLVREKALKTLRRLGRLDAETPQLINEWKRTAPGPWRDLLLETLIEIGDSSIAPWLSQLLGRAKPLSMTEKSLACKGLSKHAHAPAIPALIGLLSHKKRRVRKDAQSALESITNQQWRSGTKGKRRWNRWWREHQQEARMDWVIQGFHRWHGLRLQFPLKRQQLKKLIGLIRRGGSAANNARWLIQQDTGFFVERAHFNNNDMARFYRKWLRTQQQ